MSRGFRPSRAVVALVTAAAVLVSPVAPLLTAQTTSPKPAPAQAGAAQPAASADIDGGWPKDYATPSGGQLRIFQPQIASWDGQKKMVAYYAASYTAKGAPKSTLGTLKIEANTAVAVAERLVNFTNVKLTETNFPKLPKEQLQEVTAQVVQVVDRAAPNNELILALDRVLASLDKSQIIPKNVEGVKADPPVIFYSTSPAVLVNIDGEPIWSPIQQNDLKFAVNTNWDLFQHEASKAFYLLYNNSWLVASELKGPWKAAGKLPESFAKLPADENWKDVKAAVPGRTLSASTTPKVFVSQQPSELMLLQGPPNYLSVSGTKLLWVSNTDSDTFRLGKTGAVYYLVAGRWFSAADFTGPWTFATTSLPDDFKKIPVTHERSRVLASIPGTDQATEAVLLAQIPETARVSKKLEAPEVQYQGDPKFEPVEKTTVSRAVNTDKDIIKVGDLYYMCFQGVWFMGRSPTGPWEVTGSVPGQIYEIPTSSPAHAVTYVTVEENNSDAVVFATAAMYTGVMIAWGCAVWGSGWYYPPYVGYGGFYPYYRPYYPTYGFGASYNPWTGAYGRSAVAYGPYGGAGVTSRYNPRTGTYSRGAAAWGPYGARGAASAYNPRTNTGAATRQGAGVYGSWGQTGVARGDQWATTSRVTNNVTGNTTRVTQGSDGGGAVTRNGAGVGNNSGVVRTDNGDVYAGRDGNVYKKQGDGSWQQYDNGNGNWNSVQPTQQQRDQAQQRASDARGQAASRPATDSGTVGQLNRDSAARSEGTQRTRDQGTYGRSSGTTSSRGSGSYRPSGGGARAGGGGGRRR